MPRSFEQQYQYNGECKLYQMTITYLTISQLQETILISSELLEPSKITVVCGRDTVTFLPALTENYISITSIHLFNMSSSFK